MSARASNEGDNTKTKMKDAHRPSDTQLLTVGLVGQSAEVLGLSVGELSDFVRAI